MDTEKILILGCGYLGKQLVLDAGTMGFKVHALSRNPQTCHELTAMEVERVLPFELDDEAWHTKIRPTDYRAIIISVGSSESNEEGYRKSYLKGLHSVSKWVGKSKCRIYYTSSISVYGDSAGEWIDETVAPNPRNWRGEILLESESILRKIQSSRTCCFRLGGIYGPDRSRFLRSTSSNKMKKSQDDYYLNLIHVEDASRAILSAVHHDDQPSDLYNLTDHHPVLRSELDKFLEQQPVPESGPSANSSKRRRRESPPLRRIDASKIQKELKWKPRFPSVFDAISG